MDSVNEPQNVRCACVIANLEGRLLMPPHESLTAPVPIPLDALHDRLRVLEARKDIRGALPTDTATWDSLAWRLSRLDKNICLDATSNGYPNPPNRAAVKRTMFNQLACPTTGESVSLEMVASVIDDVAARRPGTNLLPLSKDVDLENERSLGMLLQRMWYLLGRQYVHFDGFPSKIRDLFILAVDFSLDLENNSPPGPGNPQYTSWSSSVPTRRPPPPPGVEIIGKSRRGPKKMCCGCCGCYCHPKSKDNQKFFAGSRKSRKSKVASKMKNFFKFRWVKSLACWRRRSSSSSVTSSDSSSIDSSTLFD